MGSLSIHVVTKSDRRLTARESRDRLEASPLYRERALAAAKAKQAARLSALWYCSDGFKPRYWSAS